MIGLQTFTAKQINKNENFAPLRQSQTAADILIIYFCQIV